MQLKAGKTHILQSLVFYFEGNVKSSKEFKQESDIV